MSKRLIELGYNICPYRSESNSIVYINEYGRKKITFYIKKTQKNSFEVYVQTFQMLMDIELIEAINYKMKELENEKNH